jgi:hypothetical protein
LLPQVNHAQRLHPREEPQKLRCVHSHHDPALGAGELVILAHHFSPTLNKAKGCARRVYQGVKGVD